MRLPFNGSYAINQKFNDPCCRASYAQFGMQGHNGIDYNLPNGTAVVAAVTGTVYVGYEPGGYGNYIFVTGEGYQTVYGHLQRAVVSTGQSVTAGQLIGYSNNTGNSSGPHLHFGVRPISYNVNNGFLGYVDPAPLIGGSMSVDSMTKDEVILLHRLALFSDPGPLFVNASVGKTFSQVADSLRADAPYSNPARKALDAKLASVDSLTKQVADLKAALDGAANPDTVVITRARFPGLFDVIKNSLK